MRSVALVTSSFLPRVGGVEEHVLNVARDLRRRGVKVAVWAVDQGDDGPAEVDGVPVRYLPCPLPAREARALLSFTRDFPRAVRAWRRALWADTPDLLHVHCFGPNGPWATATARLARLPLLITSHGETFADANGVFERSRLLAGSLRRAIRHAVVVTGPSRYTLDDLERRFALPVGTGAVVPNGVDLDEPVGECPAWLPERSVLAVGRMVGIKGFDLLLEAFARVGRDDVALVLAGDGPVRDALRERAEELGIADRVVLPGRVERAEVGAAMRGATVVVVPSRFESFGIVVLEAWRAGVPIVATTRGGPPEFVTDGVDGLLVDPVDTGALAHALGRLLGDDDLARRLGTAGRDGVGTYTWKRVTDDYVALYDAAAVTSVAG
jgi:glycogen(starch) synthase